MLMAEAFKHMQKVVTTGFRVCYEEIKGDFIKIGHFPEPEVEQPFAYLEQAKAAAENFAEFADGAFRNIFVVDSGSHAPVEPYETREILRSTHPRPEVVADEGVETVEVDSSAPPAPPTEQEPKKEDTTKKAPPVAPAEGDDAGKTGKKGK